MTTELLVNSEFMLSRKETHGKNRKEAKKGVPVFASRKEKSAYNKKIHPYFEIRHVIDVKGLLKEIRSNWKRYVSQVYQWIQKHPVKKVIVTGIFTIVFGLFANTANTANAAIVPEYIYQAENGEKVEDLAAAHGVTVQQIYDANGVSSISAQNILLPKVENMTVIADILNVRSEPNTESSIMKQYKEGDVVNVSFVENGWAGILIEGIIYYVSADYLAKAPSIANSETFTINSTSTSSSVYVIKKGDTFAKISRELGTSISSLQELNPAVNPAKLQIGQKINISSAAVVEEMKFQAKTMYVNATALRVRESASTNSRVIGSLPFHEIVLVNSTSNGWAQIIYKGKTSYVSEAYLSNKMAAKTETAPKDSSAYVIKKGDTLTKIGKAIGVSALSLQELNPSINPVKLQIGQAIKIPAAASAVSNQIKVKAKIEKADPQGTFRFSSVNGSTYTAKASGVMLTEILEHQGEKLELTLEGIRGQQLTLVTVH